MIETSVDFIFVEKNNFFEKRQKKRFSKTLKNNKFLLVFLFFSPNFFSPDVLVIWTTCKRKRISWNTSETNDTDRDKHLYLGIAKTNLHDLSSKWDAIIGPYIAFVKNQEHELLGEEYKTKYKTLRKALLTYVEDFEYRM